MPSTKKMTPSAARLAVLAGAARGGELVGADDVLGAEVARAEAVAAAEDAAALRSSVIAGRPSAAGRPAVVNGLRERGADVAAERVVAGQSASSVRSRMMTFFLPLSAATMAASGKGRITLTWMEPTLTPRVSRR